MLQAAIEHQVTKLDHASGDERGIRLHLTPHRRSKVLEEVIPKRLRVLGAQGMGGSDLDVVDRSPDMRYLDPSQFLQELGHQPMVEACLLLGRQERLNRFADPCQRSPIQLLSEFLLQMTAELFGFHHELTSAVFRLFNGGRANVHRLLLGFLDEALGFGLRLLEFELVFFLELAQPLFQDLRLGLELLFLVGDPLERLGEIACKESPHGQEDNPDDQHKHDRKADKFHR